MRSNAAVTFRSLLMVGSAVAIPIVAIVGKPLPDLLWTRFQAGFSVFASATEPATLPETPKFQPTTSAAMTVSPPKLPEAISAQEIAEVPADVVQTRWSPLAPPKVEPVVSSPPATQSPVSPDKSGAGDEQFRTIQQRLRQLGATWYALETWGNEGRFHFACRVAIEGNPSLTRLFQASDAEAFRAMGQVLQQVEQWKATPQSQPYRGDLPLGVRRHVLSPPPNVRLY